MAYAQQDIFGQLSYDVPVLETARKVMHDKPITYKSHRLLMREVGKEMGFKWISKLTPDELTQFEELLDLSPDFERAARKIREEDAAAAKHGSPVTTF